MSNCNKKISQYPFYTGATPSDLIFPVVDTSAYINYNITYDELISDISSSFFSGGCIDLITVHNIDGCSPINVLTDLIVNENITVNKNATILGNVTVLGTATTLNTEILLVKDNIITLNSTFLSLIHI